MNGNNYNKASHDIGIIHMTLLKLQINYLSRLQSCLTAAKITSKSSFLLLQRPTKYTHEIGPAVGKQINVLYLSYADSIILLAQKHVLKWDFSNYITNKVHHYLVASSKINILGFLSRARAIAILKISHNKLKILLRTLKYK